MYICIYIYMLDCRTIGMSDYWDVGLLGCRTIGMSDYWDVGLLDCGTIGMSDYWDVGLLGCRTVGLSDYIHFGLLGCRAIYMYIGWENCKILTTHISSAIHKWRFIVIICVENKYFNTVAALNRLDIVHACGTLKCENASICEKVAPCEKVSTLNVTIDAICEQNSKCEKIGSLNASNMLTLNVFKSTLYVCKTHFDATCENLLSWMLLWAIT